MLNKLKKPYQSFDWWIKPEVNSKIPEAILLQVFYDLFFVGKQV
jgi:hypothetical protein